MKVLVIDSDDVGLDFSLRCKDAGHDVKYFVPKHSDGSRDRTGDGLVEKVPHWEPWTKWADLIVPTHNAKYLHALEPLRKYGFPIFGPGVEGARLEIERGYGMKILKEHDIDVPAYKTFSSLEDAERHVVKTDKPYAFKPMGNEEDKSLTFVSRKPEQLANKLKRWQREGMRLKGSAMLQEIVEGVEFGVSGFFGPDGWSKWKNQNFEFKPLMPGDVGPGTGEQGSVLKYTKKCKMFDDILAPMEKHLLSIGYVGDLDVNCIVDEKGTAWPLEFTARLGWPHWMIVQRTHPDPCQWMKDLISGSDTLSPTTDTALGVVVTQPCYPFNKSVADKSIGVQILGITEKNWDSIHPAAMMSGKGYGEGCKERDCLVTSGEYVLIASGTGDTVRAASRSAYKTVDEIRIDDMMYRDDIGERLKEQIPLLQKSGYAMDWSY